MHYNITNRWTGAVLFIVEARSLQLAVEAAVTTETDLRGADLRGANLRDANLRGADLGDADLRGADLRGADLRGANLRDANLRDANLRDANLRGADLGDADLRDADLGELLSTMHIPYDPTLPARVLAQITTHPETWDQTTWHHPCGTAHCVAGWTTTLAGPLGEFLDHHWGTSTAATLLLWRKGCVLPSFAADADKAEVLEQLRALAVLAEEVARAQP